MEQPRQNIKTSVLNMEYENARRNSDQPSAQLISRSKSPLRNYRDNGNSLATYNQTETYVPTFSKTQTLNLSQQKGQYIHNITNTEPSIKTSYKPNDIPKKFEGFKRAGSMQVTNIGEMAKDVYNFIPPQNLQTICNGNNQIQMTQSYDKAASSGANTLTSGMTSAGISTHSSCKNCKKMEEQERIVTYTLNQLLNQISDVTDKERLWRQGNISFEIDNFGWNTDDEPMVDPRILKKTDSGRLLLEIKKQFLNIRKSFEEHISDIESLSKTSIFRDVYLQKENRSPMPEDNQLLSNPGRKLLSSIAEAKQYVESLRSVVFSEEIPQEIKEDIKSKNKNGSEDKNILRTLMLQLEQSKRERRILEIELSLQKKGVLQNQNNVNSTTIKQIIRQIIDEEVKQGNKEELR